MESNLSKHKKSHYAAIKSGKLKQTGTGTGNGRMNTSKKHVTASGAINQSVSNTIRKILLFFTVLSSCLVPRWYLLPLTGVSIHHIRVSIFCFSLFLLVLLTVVFRSVKDATLRGKKDLLVFGIWTAVSALLIIKTERFGESVQTQYYLFLGLLSVFVMNMAIRDMESVKICLGAIFCGVFLHLAVGSLEIINQNHFFSTGLNDTLSVWIKPVSIFFNNNDYGTFIVVLLPLAVAFLRMATKGVFLRLFAVFFSAAALAVVIYAQSDTLVLCSALVFLALTAIFLKKKYGNAILARFFIVLFAVGAVGGFVFRSAIQNRLEEFIQSERCRVNLIRNGFLFLWDSKGLGIGYGNMQNYLEFRSEYDVYGIYFFHNWYLEILFCGGVISFIAYLLFHFAKIRTLFALSILRKTEFRSVAGKAEYDPSILLLISFLIFTVACISSSSNLYSEWLWMYFGLISAYTNLLAAKNKKKGVRINEQQQPY